MKDTRTDVKVFTKRMWLHKDPDMPGNFNEIFRSRSEPLLDKKSNAACLSEEAHFDGDMIVHVATTAKAMLPKQLWNWIGSGEKVGLEIIVKARKMPLDEPITEMITKAVEENIEEGTTCVKTHDRLLFSLKDNPSVHERQFVLYKPFEDGSDRKSVEYINSYGEIIRHPNSENPQEHYIILGNVGNVVSPLLLGQTWGNCVSPSCTFRDFLIKAYQHGLRYDEAPKDETTVFNIERISEDIVTLSCASDFYGFGECLRYSISKGYMESAKLRTRNIDKTIVDIITVYRWFFNRPNLHVSIKALNRKDFDKKETEALSKLINDKVNDKWEKSIKASKKEKEKTYFDAKNLRTKSLVIPYADEIREKM